MPMSSTLAALTDRDQQDLGLEALLLAVLVRHGHGDAALVALDRFEVETVPGQAGDAACLELASKLGADGRVLEGHQARKHLDEGHLGPAAAVERRELHAHCTGAEHDRRGRDPVHEERLVAGVDHPPVGGNPGELLGPRAGRDDHRAGLDLDRFASRRGDCQTAGAVEAAATGDDIHLVLAHEELHAFVQLADHLVATPTGDRVVKMDVTGRDTEGVGMPQLVEQRSALEQRLGGDASAVQAGAADLVLLHQHHAQPQLGRADRRRVAAHPAAENGDVESFGHWILSISAGSPGPPPAPAPRRGRQADRKRRTPRKLPNAPTATPPISSTTSRVIV